MSSDRSGQRLLCKSNTKQTAAGIFAYRHRLYCTTGVFEADSSIAAIVNCSAGYRSNGAAVGFIFEPLTNKTLLQSLHEIGNRCIVDAIGSTNLRRRSCSYNCWRIPRPVRIICGSTDGRTR